jgi:hypothetical protein
MTDDVLDADARGLLELGRDQLGPDPETVARLRARIETTVAIAGTGIGVAGLAKGLGAKAIAVKLAVVAAVGIATGAAVHVVHVVRAREVTVAAPVIETTSVESVREPVQPAIAIATRDAVEVVPEPATPEPAPRVAASAMSPPRPAPPKPAPRATLARETELVELATHALRTGDLAAARAAVATYAHETGGAGQLAEDIDAIEIEALCRANDPSASTKLAAFDARWPQAGQRHRLVAACQGGH